MMTRNLLEIVAMCGGVLHAAQGTADSVRATTVTGVFTDSRKVAPGGLFVAIAGEHDDGHQFVPAAARAGAVAILVHDLDGVRSALADAGLAPGSLNLITVSDTVEALGRLARAHLADLRERAAEQGRALTVAAMTGSVGKTTTKDLTRQILAAQAPTIAPAASFNNEIGLPLTVLRADETTRFLILEMGASAPGHIAYLTSIAPPDAAAVLVVGHAHMDGFGSLDGVARAKAEIIEGLLPTGTAVVNLDDERAAAMGELAPGPVLTFSATGDARADLRADLVDHHDTRLEHACPWITLGSIDEPVDIVREHDVVGPHDLHERVLDEGQALAVIAVGPEVGLIAHVGDAGVLQGVEPARNRVVRIAVIDDDQPPVRIRLAQDGPDSLLHHGHIAVEREEDVDSHEGAFHEANGAAARLASHAPCSGHMRPADRFRDAVVQGGVNGVRGVRGIER